MDAMPLTLTVDGAVNPELIPDDVAYRQFLQGIAFRKNLTDVEQSRREAKIKRLGLTQISMAIPATANQLDEIDAWGELAFYCGCANTNILAGLPKILTRIKFSNSWTSWSDYVYIPSAEICIPQSYTCSSGTPTVTDPSIRCYCAGCSFPTCPDYGWANYETIMYVPNYGNAWTETWCIGILAEDRPQRCT